MGLFDLFKKKEKQPISDKGGIALSMPMFNSMESFSLEKVVQDLQSYWKLEVENVSGDDQTATMEIDGKIVALGFMPAPIPQDEIESILDFNYLWKNVSEDIKEMKSHIIVSVLGDCENNVEKYQIITKVNASILRTSDNALGIYQGSQTLLLSKDLYLDFADFLLEDQLPIQLWVYIGLVHGEQNSIYTYGMKEFGKSEIEILNKDLEMGELYDFILPILDYILSSNVTLKDGETIGFSAEQKIKITQSKGIYLDGETLKLDL